MSFVNPYRTQINSFKGQLWHFEGTSDFTKKIPEVIEITDSFSKIHLEIGSGSGMFLIENAARNPDTLFIGIEPRFKRSVRTVEKAQNRNINNLIVIRAKFEEVFEQVKAINFYGIYINFPDPWDKAKWYKNRVYSDANLIKFHSLIPRDGFIALKTDHGGYFKNSMEILGENSNFQTTEITEDLHNSEFNQSNIKTEFEQLFQYQKKNIYYCKAIKL